MRHLLSPEDIRFAEDFAACRVQPGAFDHRAHLRLAYIYLAGHDTDTAVTLMRGALSEFIRRKGLSAAKYNETLTRAWILAVRHFMEMCPDAESSADFIARNPRLLDSKIMLAHYSAEVLFSAEARAQFVEPNVAAIPRYDG